MKKGLIILLSIIITSIMPLSASAANNIHTFDRMTIEFSENSLLTYEQQETISCLVVNGMENSDDVITYNLLCTLFGHDSTTETFTVIEHCVSDTAPRCLKSFQEVTACTRCETVIDIYTISSYYIYCCD